jgi:hypothetical protein
MHLCPDCAKPCGCDCTEEYTDSQFDECTHYQTSDCDGMDAMCRMMEEWCEQDEFELGGES